MNGLGGKIEAGEAPLDAIKREFLEEAGAAGFENNHPQIRLMSFTLKPTFDVKLSYNHKYTINMTLGDRMNLYEARPKSFTDPSMSIFIRLYGKVFSKFTKKLEKPFDYCISKTMEAACHALCSQIQDAKFAHTQSDEISILIIPKCVEETTSLKNPPIWKFWESQRAYREKNEFDLFPDGQEVCLDEYLKYKSDISFFHGVNHVITKRGPFDDKAFCYDADLDILCLDMFI